MHVAQASGDFEADLVVKKNTRRVLFQICCCVAGTRVQCAVSALHSSRNALRSLGNTGHVWYANSYPKLLGFCCNPNIEAHSSRSDEFRPRVEKLGKQQQRRLHRRWSRSRRLMQSVSVLITAQSCVEASARVSLSRKASPGSMQQQYLRDAARVTPGSETLPKAMQQRHALHLGLAAQCSQRSIPPRRRENIRGTARVTLNKCTTVRPHQLSRPTLTSQIAR